MFKMINLKKNLKFFFFLICLGFLLYKFNDSYSEIKSKLKFQLSTIFFILSCHIIFLNLIAVRAFLLIKFSTGYLYSFYDWAKLYFESLLLNEVITLTGTVYRAIQLKKREVNYAEFISISYYLLGSYLLISLTSIFLALFFFQKIFFKNYSIIFIMLIFFLFYSPIIIKNLTTFLLKFKILSKYLRFIERVSKLLREIYLNKKIIILLLSSTVLVHIFEVAIFYLICNIFLGDVDLQVLIILFATKFIANRITFIAGLPGATEIIVGLAGTQMGIVFVDGALIQLTLRFFYYLSILFNNGVYIISSYFDKNKFENRLE